jgi:hypothetical protein
MTTGQSIYDGFVESIGGQKKAQETNLLGHARLLLREAAVTFDSGAYAASALVCRATIEAAFYFYLTRKWSDSQGYWTVNLPRTLSDDVRMVLFDELIRGIESTGVLSRQELREAHRIQADGNLIAHFVSRRETGVLRLIPSPEPPLPVKTKQKGGWVKLWVGHDDALSDLRDTVSILTTLAKRMITERPPV